MSFSYRRELVEKVQNIVWFPVVRRCRSTSSLHCRGLRYRPLPHHFSSRRRPYHVPKCSISYSVLSVKLIGAGFYVDALEAKWSKNYRMYSYVRDELPHLIAATFKECDPQRQGIFGHSMGGHGAIVIGLRNPQIFRSISALAPICNPMRCSWGKKVHHQSLWT